MIINTESGQDSGLEALVNLPAIEGAVEGLVVNAIASPKVQAELTATARPLIIEAAAYIVGGVAVALILFGRR